MNDFSRFIDLHTHTSFSDGCLSPEELIEEAIWKGLTAIAITDHDTLEGLPRAQRAGAARGLEVIGGVELSCELEGCEVHLVGLFLTPSREMEETLQAFREQRIARMKEMVARFVALGIPIRMEDLPQDGDRAYGRPHLARLLVKQGITSSVNEAFARYLGDNGPVYVPKPRLAVDRGIALIHASRGLAILAHPGVGNLVDRIDALVERGIDGIEVYYPHYTEADARRIREAATRHFLVLSGGADYHGPGQGFDLGTLAIPYSFLDALKERKEKRWPSDS